MLIVEYAPPHSVPGTCSPSYAASPKWPFVFASFIRMSLCTWAYAAMALELMARRHRTRGVRHLRLIPSPLSFSARHVPFVANAPQNGHKLTHAPCAPLLTRAAHPTSASSRGFRWQRRSLRPLDNAGVRALSNIPCDADHHPNPNLSRRCFFRAFITYHPRHHRRRRRLASNSLRAVGRVPSAPRRLA